MIHTKVVAAKKQEHTLVIAGMRKPQRLTVFKAVLWMRVIGEWCRKTSLRKAPRYGISL